MTLLHYIIFCYLFVFVWCYGEDFSDSYHYHRAFPQDVMVDVINNFGLALLEAHNEGNENNIALSPYGAASVLVALGEGIRGFAVKEIHETTHIPLDISVVRVGLRDIHRHLKSYFIPKEGFLAGLTLSNEQVPLTPRYKEILRFYGYDLESFNSALYPDAFMPSSTASENYSTTTPSMNQTTLENNDLATTTPTDDNLTTLESRTEGNEPLPSTMTTTMPSASTENYATETSEGNVENETNTMKKDIVTTPSFQNASSTEKSGTTTEQLTSTTDTSSINGNSTVSEIAQSTTDKPKVTIEKTTTPSIKTTTKDIEPVTTKRNSTVEIQTTFAESTEAATTTPFKEDTLSSGDTTVAALDGSTTTKYEAALELSDMVRDEVTELPMSLIFDVEMIPTAMKETTVSPIATTVKESLTTTTNLLEEKVTSSMLSTESIETTTNASPNEDILKGGDSTISVLDVSTTAKYKEVSELLDKVGDETTNLPMSMIFTTPGIETEMISASTTPATDDSILTTSNQLQNTSPNSNGNNDEGITQISTMSSTTDVINDTGSSTDEDNSMEDFVITTSVTHSISKITTSYETSSILSTNFPQNTDGTTTTEYVITDTESSETLLAVSTEETSYPTTTTTNISEAIRNKEKAQNSTNLTNGTDTKRGVRSIIDYVIARYYDGFSRRHYNDGSYRPEEKLSFLVYGKFRETNINFMTYDAVLPAAYIPIIDALALSFPLDSKEYYLLLLLPIEETGIDKLINNLKQRTSLRSIISSLTYSHVKAVIPSFMLKGYVILTHTLQKLGIRRIFEPRHTDFSLMTKEKDIYVTNIEQAVTVTIRNYVDPDNLSNYRNLQQLRPIEFKADHPFLYFVMDTDIHVNLMAGKIVNPLNSRIR